MKITKKDAIITLFPEPGEVKDLSEVFEETEIESLASLRQWCYLIRRKEGISLRIKKETMVREA